MNKPVFVVIGTGQGEHTRNQLIETIKTMDFKINSSYVLLLKGARSKIDPTGAIADANTRTLFEDFCQRIEELI